jgi:ribonuclease III
MLSSEQIQSLESSIEYHFKDTSLLVEALSHPSLKQHALYQTSKKNYERLELLGDSILGFVITEILFKNFTDYDEGQLAKRRSFLICKDTLCKVGTKLNLAEYIIMTHGEEISGGRSNPNNIENAMEALISAIYLDSNIDTTKLIISNLWSEFLSITDLTAVDPKTSLQEWSQSTGHFKPVYEVIKREGSAHLPVFTVSVTVKGHKQIAHGNSVKAAEKKAAQKLLEMLDSEK